MFYLPKGNLTDDQIKSLKASVSKVNNNASLYFE